LKPIVCLLLLQKISVNIVIIESEMAAAALIRQVVIDFIICIAIGNVSLNVYFLFIKRRKQNNKNPKPTSPR
jgi:hypothetical protein